MAVTYQGALSNGPDFDASRYYNALLPSTPTGDFAIFALVKFDCVYSGSDFAVTTAEPIGIAQNFLTGTGSGGGDSYMYLLNGNDGTAGNRRRVRVKVASGGVNLLGSGTQLLGTTQFNPGDVALVVIQSNGGTVQFYTCLRDGTAVLENSATRNGSFGARALGTWNFMRGSTTGVGLGSPNAMQMFGVANRAFTTSEIEQLAAGTDPESIVASGDRSALWLFDQAAATITATWGANNATRQGTWTNQRAGSPLAPNAAARLEVTNHPLRYQSYGVNDDGTATSRPVEGTYTGFVPSSFEARILNLDGTVAQDWTALTGFAAAAGTWSGSLSVPVGGPYRLDVRDATDTAIVWQGITAFLGCPVHGTMGQSPGAYFEGEYKGNVTLTGELYIADPAVPNQVRKAVTSSTAAGLARMANQWQADVGKPILWVKTAVGGTTSEAWATKAANVWPQLLNGLAYSGAKKVSLAWLQGSSDNGLAEGVVKGNLDTIVSNLDDDVEDAGTDYRFVMIPHNRQTSSAGVSNGRTRQYQYQWARDHAYFGTKVLHGVQWIDMLTDAEFSGTAQAGGASTITLAADTETVQPSQLNGVTVQITSGTGAGQTRTAGASNPFNVTSKVLTVTSAWTTVPDATSVYRITGVSPHPARVGGVERLGPRYARDLANKYGLHAQSGRGPYVASATYPEDGDGSIIDVQFTHRHGAALRTVNGGTDATGVADFEVSEDTFTTTETITAAAITSPTTVRLTLSAAPTDKTALRVRYGRLAPVVTDKFDAVENFGLGDLLYDDSSLELPADFTADSLAVTEAAANEAIYVGDTLAEAIYVGENPAVAVYVGEDLVWSA